MPRYRMRFLGVDEQGRARWRGTGFAPLWGGFTRVENATVFPVETFEVGLGWVQ